MPIRVSEEQFARLVDQAIASLPDEFRARMDNVSVEVLPLPTSEMLRTAQPRPCRPERLLGLYHGVPLTKKTVWAPYDWPEQIFLFQRNIEAICDSPAQIVSQVRRTVLHEIGHHFGMSEEDLDELGYA